MDQIDNPPPVLERLLRAVNDHDLDALVSCFALDYVNETPAHPRRGFRGNAQVRRNWAQIFAGAPDIRATVPRHVRDRDELWTEWQMSGTRADGAPVGIRGVVIFGLDDAAFTSARFYLEPVEETTGDVDVHTQRVVGAPGAPASSPQH